VPFFEEKSVLQEGKKKKEVGGYFECGSSGVQQKSPRKGNPNNF